MPLVPLALERQGADNLTIGIVAPAWGIGMLATALAHPRGWRRGSAPCRSSWPRSSAGAALTVAYT